MNNKMKVQLVHVTPALAENYLKFNDKNRKPSDNILKFLTNEMLNNRFKENGESIVFDWSNRLNDGQHRLLAIIKSGRSFTIPVVTGVEPLAMATYDTGKNRSAGDVLSMNGFKYFNSIASFIKLINKYDNKKSKMADYGSNNRNETLTNQMILDYCMDNYYWIENLVAKSFYIADKSLSPKVLSTTQIALIVYLIGGETPDDIVYKFINNIVGLSRVADSAPSYIYTKLYNSKINKEPLNFYWVLGMIIKAYNYYIDGNPAIKYFKFDISNELPKVNK